MFAAPPPGHQVVNPTCIRNPVDGRCYSSNQAAWEAFLDQPSVRLPPGFVQVASISRPGQFAYYHKLSGEKYATVELAWQAHLRKYQPATFPASVAPVKGGSGQVPAKPAAPKPEYASPRGNPGTRVVPAMPSPSVSPSGAPGPPSGRPVPATEMRAPRPAPAALAPATGEASPAASSPTVAPAAVAPASGAAVAPAPASGAPAAPAPAAALAAVSEESPIPEVPADTAVPVEAFVTAQPRSFKDAAFPASDASIGKVVEEDRGSRLTISLQEKKNIRWMRLPEVIAQMPAVAGPNAGKLASQVRLFGDIDIHHLIQGVAGDCWLLATLACLAEFPEQIRGLFSEQSANLEGKYSIHLYDLSRTRWEVVTIDDFVPCVKSHGHYVPVFARPYANEMWAVLLEKAMAKFVGTYAGISGGHEAYALIALTGFPLVYQFRREVTKAGDAAAPAPKGEEEASLLSSRNRWVRGWSQYNKREEPSCGFRPSLDNTVYSNTQLFDKMAEYDSRDYLIAGSITNFREPKTQTGYYRHDGLVLGHAYSVIAVVEVPLANESVRLVQLRNPHGAGRMAEWKGDWSDESPLWSEYPEVAARLDYVKTDDGVFWMPFQAFVDIFDRILVLCKSMGMQRDLTRLSLRRQSQIAKAETGRAALGVALKKLASHNTLDAIKRMSVQTYDPYLNVPDWIRNDQTLLRQWIVDKGQHL